ncbi:MAG: FIST N-terminal domain-containing protein, partial [Candidatus Eisenbacteria bacterium]|nr:FIST N-terminal domain-containing protein [Candidatus Eisenbacteria bacterium]
VTGLDLASAEIGGPGLGVGAKAGAIIAAELAKQLRTGETDLAVAFFSPDFGPHAATLAREIRRRLSPRVLIGCAAEGVIGEDREIEGGTGISLLAGRLPEVELTGFLIDPADWHGLLEPAEELRAALHAPIGTRLFLLVADPFSVPIDALLARFNLTFPGIPVPGGMASGANAPGRGIPLYDDKVFRRGAVGISLAGDFDVDAIVSQGCRPIGPIYTVTAADENEIRTLDGAKPLELLEEIVEELSDEDRELLRNGLFVGRAIGSRPEGPGRGDFLVRGVMDLDRESGSISIGDYVDEGDVVQFHLRDAETAREDLQMMLSLPALIGAPSGGLLFSCNGRGTRLYDRPNGDISTIQDALGGIPMAGFFAAGEIGPIGGKNFLHGHTASIALLRPRKAKEEKVEAVGP